jgi:hypothetical protein
MPTAPDPAPPPEPLPATPEEILRVLADPERLSLAGTLARGDAGAADLARALDLPVTRVRRHLSRLERAGVVRIGPDRRTYSLAPQTLRRAAQEVGPPRDAGLALGAVDDEEEAILRHYFAGGRLREVPAKQSKRRAVLTRLALEFEPGVRYTEAEVNQTLRRFHDDYASLRRFLVDEQLLSRDRSRYWRSGGPVDV